MYDPLTGRFQTKDSWQGDYNRPLSLNRWMYVEGNPVNFTDPSGHFLDPSEPTFRGTIIHQMIEAQYRALYDSGDVRFNFTIPLGSARGLKKYNINGTIYWGTDKVSFANGYADIVDWVEKGLYEIKPYRSAQLGQATVNWYLAMWNYEETENGRHRYLTPGKRYPLSPTIVGTDPKDPSKWITAEAYGKGVILYKTLNKSDPRTVPVFVFEWDVEQQKVVRRSGAKAAQWYPQPDFGPALIGIGILLEALKICGPMIPVFVP
jgi:hypothetical protein